MTRLYCSGVTVKLIDFERMKEGQKGIEDPSAGALLMSRGISDCTVGAENGKNNLIPSKRLNIESFGHSDTVATDTRQPIEHRSRLLV